MRQNILIFNIIQKRLFPQIWPKNLKDLYHLNIHNILIVWLQIYIMQTLQHSIGLGLLSQEQVQFLSSKETSVKCNFFYEQDNDPKQKIFQTKMRVQLLIIQGYVVQKSLNSGNILGGFKCIYQNQFEVLRTQLQNQKNLGDPVGLLLFIEENQSFKEIKLILDDSQTHLEKFARILSTHFIVRRGFRQAFRPIVRLGKGMTAIVYKAESLLEHQQVAIKTFKRAVYFKSHGKQSFKREFEILTKINHKNLCRLIGVYQTQNSTYIVMQLLKYSLFSFIRQKGFPSINKIKDIMRGLLKGIRQVHALGIMHRDIKLENIMMRESNNKLEPVIVDFGLAEYQDNKTYLYTRCGTPGYVAPQILEIKSNEKKQYTTSCDIFSLGVIFYILLFKNPVFAGNELKDVISQNTKCEINFDFPSFQMLPQNGKDLIKSMLSKNPAQRISAEQALLHPFLNEVEPSSGQKQSKTIESIPNQQKMS